MSCQVTRKGNSTRKRVQSSICTPAQAEFWTKTSEEHLKTTILRPITHIRLAVFQTCRQLRNNCTLLHHKGTISTNFGKQIGCFAIKPRFGQSGQFVSRKTGEMWFFWLTINVISDSSSLQPKRYLAIAGYAKWHTPFLFLKLIVCGGNQSRPIGLLRRLSDLDLVCWSNMLCLGEIFYFYTLIRIWWHLRFGHLYR